MADSKITQLTALAATPATNDQLMIVDVSDTSMAASGTNKKLSAAYLARSGADATLIAGDGKTLTLPASGTAALLGIDQTFTGSITLPNVRSSSGTDIADDNVMSMSPGGSGTWGMLLIWTRYANTGDRACIVAFRAGTNPFCVVLGQSGTTVATATTALTGTTGTDGKFTVAAATDGKVYIENRTGALVNVGYLLLN